MSMKPTTMNKKLSQAKIHVEGETKRFNADLPVDLHYNLKRHAMETDVTMSELLVEWVRKEIPNYKK